MKKEKENYEQEQLKLENKRKRRKRNSIFQSLNRVPSVHSGHSDSWKQFAANEPQTELERELIKISEKEQINIIHLKQMATNSKALLRPVGGRNYKHIKSRFKDIMSKTKHGTLSIAIMERNGRNRKLRPLSAWSSPTKIGNAYENIEWSDSDYGESKN